MTETRPTKALKLHPEAEQIPPMLPDEWRAFRDDIAERGIQVPIEIMPDWTILDGRHRWRAAQELGLEEVPVRVVNSPDPIAYMTKAAVLRRHLTAGQRAALAVLYAPKLAKEAEARQMASRYGGGNISTTGDPGKTRDQAAEIFGTNAHYVSDAKKLQQEAPDVFEQVLAGAMDMTLAKAERKARERQARAETVTALEVAQAAPVEADTEIVVRLGDTWKLGRHILYCGDTSKAAFRALLRPAALAFADPPYGAGVKGFDDSAFYWEHDYLLGYADVVAVTPGIVSIFEFARKTSMSYRWSLATWITNGMTRGAVGFGNWIYTALFTEGSVYRQAQDFSRVTISTGQTNETEHKGRKPAEYMTWLIGLFTEAGQLVIDPFLGSGQTLYACEQMGRDCIGGEIDQLFCKHIIKRWETITNGKAVKV